MAVCSCQWCWKFKGCVESSSHNYVSKLQHDTRNHDFLFKPYVQSKKYGASYLSFHGLFLILYHLSYYGQFNDFIMFVSKALKVVFAWCRCLLIINCVRCRSGLIFSVRKVMKIVFEWWLCSFVSSKWFDVRLTYSLHLRDILFRYPHTMPVKIINET